MHNRSPLFRVNLLSRELEILLMILKYAYVEQLDGFS